MENGLHNIIWRAVVTQHNHYLACLGVIPALRTPLAFGETLGAGHIVNAVIHLAHITNLQLLYPLLCPLMRPAPLACSVCLSLALLFLAALAFRLALFRLCSILCFSFSIAQMVGDGKVAFIENDVVRSTIAISLDSTCRIFDAYQTYAAQKTGGSFCIAVKGILLKHFVKV